MGNDQNIEVMLQAIPEVEAELIADLIADSLSVLRGSAPVSRQFPLLDPLVSDESIRTVLSCFRPAAQLKTEEVPAEIQSDQRQSDCLAIPVGHQELEFYPTSIDR